MMFALFGPDSTLLFDNIEADVKTGEYHTWGSQPTGFTVESGAYDADHIIELPDGLEITFAMGNADPNAIGVGGIPLSGVEPYGTRAAAMMDAMHAAIKRRTLVQVVTRHMVYDSMCILDVRVDHVSPWTGAITGRVAFQQVPRRVVEIVTVPEAIVADDRKKTASSTVEAGRSDGVEPSAEQRGSVLQQIGRILRGND